MLMNLATVLRVVIAILFLLLVGFGAPLMDMPLSLLAWTLVLFMAYVDLWCLRRMRAATRGTKALLSELMALSSAGAIMLASMILSLAQRDLRWVDGALLLVFGYIAWRCRTVIDHLRAGTEPAPRTSALDDSGRMVRDLRARLRDGADDRGTRSDPGAN